MKLPSSKKKPLSPLSIVPDKDPPVEPPFKEESLYAVVLDLFKKVELMWAEHPRLALPYKYGVDLLEFGGSENLMPWDLRLPNDADDVYKWPWRKVQQYFVRVEGQDPGDRDSVVLRARLTGAIKGMKSERMWLARRDPQLFGHFAPPTQVRVPITDTSRIATFRLKRR